MGAVAGDGQSKRLMPFRPAVKPRFMTSLPSGLRTSATSGRSAGRLPQSARRSTQPKCSVSPGRNMPRCVKTKAESPSGEETLPPTGNSE